MADVLVCVKRVPDFSGEVLLSDDAQSADARYVGHTLSNHDLCAVETAVQVAAATGGSATVLTVGSPDAVEQLRTALGVGCTAATLVEADPVTLGPADVAREIAAVVAEHEAGRGSAYDLVLLGNDAADSGDFQVGTRLAKQLARPVVTGVQTVTLDGDRATLVSDVAEGRETYRVPTPAVVTVLEGGVEPRYPTITGRMKAKKIPIEERSLTAEPAGSGRVRLRLPQQQAETSTLLGEGPEAAPAVVDLLQQLGVAR